MPPFLGFGVGPNPDGRKRAPLPVAVLGFAWAIDGGEFTAMAPRNTINLGDMTGKQLEIAVTSALAPSTITGIDTEDEDVLTPDDEPPVAVAADDTEVLTFTPDDLAGGEHSLDVTLTIDGQTYDFTFVFSIVEDLVFGDTFTGANEDPFVDDNWTIELYTGGNVQLLSNRLRTSNSTGGDGLNMLWFVGEQIPADWVTITVEVAAEFAAAVFCNAAIALCMDDPATGNATHSGASTLQNGYAVEFRRGGFEEIVTRFHGGARTNLHNVDDSSLDTSGALRVVFTKMVDRVRMEIYFADVLLATVDDTDANRKTGACYVGLGSYAPSTNYVYFDGFEVTATF